ncbi:MAG: hypothetical protein O8C61_05090 [Candidatus Methanoperedens sp.]|nr:hypothetical protein [Candidatus Methanoperedens sp.]
MKKSFSFFVIFGILAILLISGCTQKQPAANQTPVQTPVTKSASEQPTVKLTTGNYIVDNAGKTLYFFTKDVTEDSNCSGSCINLWPAFYQEKISVSSGLISSDFGTITRTDGTKQTTFKGWPLYYFSRDVSPGDIKGDGFNNIWFVARPDYTIFIADKDNLIFLVDSKGNTLYNFTKDGAGVSNCKGACLNLWSVFYSQNIVAPSIINASDFGVITNSAGSKQSTYKQMPLYYFNNDTARGDTNGENFNKVWFIIEPYQLAAVPAPVQSQVATSSAPGIKVTSFPSSAHGDTIIAVRWEVSGGTPGNISNTAILWDSKSGSATVSDYSKATVIQTGKTLQQFSAEINIPPSGAVYFRAHAIVDGTDVFSQEYQISVSVQTSGY